MAGVLVFTIIVHEETKGLKNWTMFSQGLLDWTKESWVDFVWSPEGECPDGYEAIGATWHGALPYNNTKSEELYISVDQLPEEHNPVDV